MNASRDLPITLGANRSPASEPAGQYFLSAYTDCRREWAARNPVPPWEWHDRSDSGSNSGVDRDCSDFSTQAEAQRFYESHQPVSTDKII